MPTQDTVVAERFFDEAGGMQLVLHAPFGARINRAWGLALRKRFCRTFNFELQAAATDNGLVLSLKRSAFLPAGTGVQLLEAGDRGARADASHVRRAHVRRALEMERRAGPGGSAVLRRPQGSASDSAHALGRSARRVFPDQVACAENLTGEIRIPDHPLVKETIDNCLHEAMDLEGLKEILDRMGEGTLRTVAVDTREPSPFCHEILNANPYAFLDDAPLEERRTRAVQMRRTLSSEDATEPGHAGSGGDRASGRGILAGGARRDELHDALLTLILLPADLAKGDEWREWYASLERAGRASTLNGHWVATERLEIARVFLRRLPRQPS